VRFHFAWPDGAKARVSYRSEVRRTDWGWTSPRTASGTHLLTGEARLEGTRVSGPRIPGRAPKDDAFSPLFAPLFSQWDVEGYLYRDPLSVPAVLLSPSGQVLEVEGGEDLVARMQGDLLESSLSEPARRRYRSMYTQRFVSAAAQEAWSAMVGMWAGQPAEPSRRFQVRRVMTVPALGLDIGIDATGVVGRKVECEIGLDGTCLAVTAVWVVGREDLSAALRDGALDHAVTGVEVRQELTGVLHVETLQPESIELRRHTHLSYRNGAGFTEQWTRGWTFAWQGSQDATVRRPAE
jgi:hypothetical protein